MKHLQSNKNGNQAERILLDMLKDDSHKHRYVSAKLSQFSEVSNVIVANYMNDTTSLKTTKYLLRIHKEYTVANTIHSQLTSEQQDHLRNALTTRYRKIIRKYKLPHN